MKIQVLGSGCPTCKKLNQMTKKAVEELGLEEEVEYLTGQKGIQKIVELGVMSSPVLAIDDKPVLAGLDEVEKIKEIIREHQNGSQ